MATTVTPSPPNTDSASVTRAIARAREANPAWAALPVRERAARLGRFHDLLFDRRHDVARTISDETGKPAAEATSEVMLALDFARYYARVAPRELAARRFRPRSLAMARKRVTIIQQPFGVVGVISPWNYPFMLAAAHLLPVLVAGNVALLKPSELTTATGAILVELLHGAGVPRDALHFLPGAGETGAALVGGGCDKIFFTGSEATGRAIAMRCAEQLIPCVLELGGSDPAIVLEDADIPLAARGIAWARFYNAGQSCVAPKRLFVVEAIHDAFLRELAKQVEQLRVGSDEAADVGPLVHPKQRALLDAQLEDALARGARIAARAPLPEGADDDEGAFAAPTVLDGVTPEMRVMREETFGPLLPVVPVRDADDAVRRANETSFGLSASIWTRDRRRGESLAERLDAGTVSINDALIVAGMAEVPHGGVKASGIGRSHGLAGLHECVQPKAIVEERFPRLKQAWWFGGGSEQTRALDAFVRFAHGRSWGERLAAVRGMRALLGGKSRGG